MQLSLNYVLSPHSMQKAGIITLLYAHDSEYCWALYSRRLKDHWSYQWADYLSYWNFKLRFAQNGRTYHSRKPWCQQENEIHSKTTDKDKFHPERIFKHYQSKCGDVISLILITNRVHVADSVISVIYYWTGATWNLFVLYHKMKRLTVTSFMHLSSSRS